MSIHDFDLIPSVHHSVAGLDRAPEICRCGMLHVPSMLQVRRAFDMLELNLEELSLVERLNDELWPTLSPLFLA